MSDVKKYDGNVYYGHIFKGVDKICGKDDLRPTMKQAIIEDGKIVATDGFHMIVIPLSFFKINEAEAEKLEGKSISGEVLQKLGALKASQKWGVTEQGIVIFKAHSLSPALIYPLESKDAEGVYPRYKAVIPDESSRKDVGSFYFKPQLLMNIEKIYESYNTDDKDSVRLESYGHNRAFLFKTEKTDFLGLVMPIMVKQI